MTQYESTRIEDWPKTSTWDLTTDVDELERIFGRLDIFPKDPCWEACPQETKDEIMRRLRGRA